MKPIKLTMSAFGPFAHQELIDFREIAKEPIFLICGPTGAGKTTIFDGISYALYGDASGQERKPDGMRSDFAPDHILTQVELVFEVRGKQYRIMRQPKQARPKKAGPGMTELPSRAELTYLDSQGQPLVFTKANEISEKIKEIIGLGPDQFKQIIMLPQGEFRKLLTADSSEREKILREIFDAQKYLEFQLNLKAESRGLEGRIREIKTHQDQYMKLFQASPDSPLASLLQNPEVDGPELFKLVDRQNKEDQKQAILSQEKASQVSQMLDRQKELYFQAKQENERLEDLRQVRRRLQDLMAQADRAKAEEKRLDQIRKALSLKPYAENYLKTEKDLARLSQEVDQLSHELGEANQNKEKIELAYQAIKSPQYQEKQGQRDLTIQGLKQQIPLIERLLDLKQTYVGLAKAVKEETKNLEAISRHKTDLLEKIDQYEQVLLASEGIEEKKILVENWQKNFARLSHIFKQYQQNQLELARLEGEEKNLQIAEAKAEANYQRQLEKLHQNHVFAIQAGLKEGDTCPVCQGIYHGGALVDQAEISSLDLEQAEGVRKQVQDQRLAFNQKKTARMTQASAYQSQLLEESGQATRDDLAPYFSQGQDRYEKNQELLADYGRQIEGRLASKQGLGQAKHDLEKISSQIEQASQTHTQMQLQLEGIAGQAKSLKQNINLPYQDNYTRDLVQSLQGQLAELEADQLREAEYRHQLEENYHQINSHQAQIMAFYQSKEKQRQESQARFQDQTREFSTRQRQNGFTSQAEWEDFVNQEEQIDQVSQWLKDYQADYITTLDLESRLSKEVKIELNHDLKQMEVEIDQISQSMQAYDRQAIVLQARIQENCRILNELDKMNQEKIRLKRAYDQVSTFAGVANGDNPKKLTFERYVLAAFLEDILQVANYRLEKMTGRYSLRRKEEVTHKGRQSGLEIEVFDAFTGKTRSINTLSGGEGFKSALAMALALSEVVSTYAGGIELDTLFIDEGFGTLDPESLDSAIDCIMDLQAKGKMIGIISHVSELKERIPAKLVVNQTPKGSFTQYYIGQVD